jgi:hypothetical protein
VYKSKYYPRWVSADNEYWVHFTDPGNPFAPGNDPIDVPPHGKSQQLAITVPDAEIPQGGKYYKYEIWNQYNSATNAHTKCKDADDDHDTGLNIKR